MDVALFNAILEKIKLESDTGKPVLICLYNWGEPLLHPRLVELVHAVHAAGFHSDVSTNLNVADVRPIVDASPNKLIVSVSGYYQETYEQGHRGGNINLVLSNLHKIRYHFDKRGREFPVEIFYHMYRHNMGADVERFRNLASDLGFGFFAEAALILPLEKAFRYLDGTLSMVDRTAVERLLIHPGVLIRMAEPYKDHGCPEHDMTVINHDGSVSLCFPVYDYEYNIAPNFLETSKEALKALKLNHEVCRKCMSHGLHAVAHYFARAELNASIEARLQELGSSFRVDQIPARGHAVC